MFLIFCSVEEQENRTWKVSEVSADQRVKYHLQYWPLKYEHRLKQKVLITVHQTVKFMLDCWEFTVVSLFSVILESFVFLK